VAPIFNNYYIRNICLFSKLVCIGQRDALVIGGYVLGMPYCNWGVTFMVSERLVLWAWGLDRLCFRAYSVYFVCPCYLGYLIDNYSMKVYEHAFSNLNHIPRISLKFGQFLTQGTKNPNSHHLTISTPQTIHITRNSHSAIIRKGTHIPYAVLCNTPITVRHA